VVLAEKFIKFNNMTLEDLQKQLQELEKIDPTSLDPKQLQELVDKLSSISDRGEELLNEDFDFYLENELEEEDMDDIIDDFINEEE